MMFSNLRLVIFFPLLYLIEAYAKESYVAVVFEANTQSQKNATDTMGKNLDYYEDLLVNKIPTWIHPDIVVLPEYGLTGLVKETKDYAISIPEPNLNITYTSILKQLSEIAHERNYFLVANLLEVSKGEFYSTTVVFNTTGFIVAKYRKINLDNEPNLTPGNISVTFRTSFGTFGILTSSDIINDFPSRSILNDSAVTNIIFTSAFKSPFRKCFRVQAEYASRNGINLLAASWSSPFEDFGGTGIYSGKDRLRHYISGVNSSKAIFTSVPKLSSKIIPNITYGPFNVTGYKSEKTLCDGLETNVLDFSQNLTAESRICTGSICCSVKASVLNDATDSLIEYRLVVKSGEEHICALHACGKGKNPTNCGSRLMEDNPRKSFTPMLIEPTCPTCREVLSLRLTWMLSSLKPTSNLSYYFDTNINNSRLIHGGPQLKGVITFGLSDYVDSAMMSTFFIFNLLLTGILIFEI